MNAYIPVLDQQPPPGFICNVKWRHIGPQKIAGHTPPRLMDVVCPCVECVAEAMAGQQIQLEGAFGREFETDLLEDVVLGPVWFGHEEPVGDVAEYVGLYDRVSMENK